MKKRYDTYIWGAFFILIAFVAVAGFIVPALRDREAPDPVTIDEVNNTYVNQTYNVTFSYPGNYRLVTNTDLTENGLLSSVSFFEENEYRAFLESEEAREGPPGMTFEIYENPDALEEDAWLEERDYFGIPEREEPSPVSVDTGTGVRFAWSGLYEGETVVLSQDDRIYVWSYTYLEQDPAQEIFENMLKSVVFE